MLVRGQYVGHREISALPWQGDGTHASGGPAYSPDEVLSILRQKYGERLQHKILTVKEVRRIEAQAKDRLRQILTRNST